MTNRNCQSSLRGFVNLRASAKANDAKEINIRMLILTRDVITTSLSKVIPSYHRVEGP